MHNKVIDFFGDITHMRFYFRSLLIVFGFIITAQADTPQPIHAITMNGVPKYGPGAAHFDFVNPNAPKQGTMRMGEVGTFDSLNPWILKGVPAARIAMTRVPLLTRSPEEPFTLCGAVAETMEVASDRSWIIFNLRPIARWENGERITADDVIFSYHTWMSQGQPFMKTFYSKVDTIEKLSDTRVKFTFKKTAEGGYDREVPMVMGLMPLLPKKVYEGKDLSKISLEPLMSNGPYRIKSFDVGRSITYERVKNWWGENLGVFKGRNNFDIIHVDYYRSRPIMFEAFKAGKLDAYWEDNPQKWFSDYNSLNPARFKKEELEHGRPADMNAFVFNTRRPMFKDIRVRKALSLVFNFDHLNTTLFKGAYTRTKSFFDNYELTPAGKPTPGELAVLTPYRSVLNPAVFGPTYNPPSNRTPGDVRRNVQQAQALLREAGWVMERGVLVNATTKKPFVIELILNNDTYEKAALEFKSNLKLLGIELNVRVVDATQYLSRQTDFDYDMMAYTWGAFKSPGNELINKLTSKAANTNGSRNYAGIESPVVDTIIQNLLGLTDRTLQVNNIKALDRILMAGYYVLPLYYSKKDRIAYNIKLRHPKHPAAIEGTMDAWWSV